MTKIRIEMDESFRWWPVTEEENQWRTGGRVFVPTFEIDETFLAKYRALHREYQDLQEQFEQLYRIERGLDPWPNVEIPNHTTLKTVSP